MLLVAVILLLTCFCNADEQYVPWKFLVPAQKIHFHEAQHAALREALNHTIHSTWDLFKTKYPRIFKHPLEEAHRFEIFAMNFVKVHLHNQKFYAGKTTYQLIMNKFSDWTSDELRTLSGLKIPNRLSKSASTHKLDSRELPEKVDWREHGAVTPVKNQGNCGSCWAFSSTGAIEGQYFVANKDLLSFSEQQLVDCSSAYGNNGCEGGFMDNAFRYLEKSNGLNTEEEYPYVSGNTSKPNPFCYFKKSFPHVRVTGFVDVDQYNEQMLMHALATKGPVSIAINAAETFPYYHSGVYSDENCFGEPNDLNHGVLLVGYGKEGNVPYWLVKNSWGPSWGESGYVKILRNSSNICGVTTMPSYPIVESV